MTKWVVLYWAHYEDCEPVGVYDTKEKAIEHIKHPIVPDALLEGYYAYEVPYTQNPDDDHQSHIEAAKSIKGYVEKIEAKAILNHMEYLDDNRQKHSTNDNGGISTMGNRPPADPDLE